MSGTDALARVAASAALGLAVFGLAVLPAGAVGTDLASAPPGASSCSGCHAVRAGTTSVPPIHGRPADEIMAALDGFRSGKRPATVMNRIAPGFSQDESRAIATWLSQQPAPQ